MLGRQVEGETNPEDQEQVDAVLATEVTVGGPGRPDDPVMPAPPFLTFSSRPTLPHQVPGVGFESGRDSRAR